MFVPDWVLISVPLLCGFAGLMFGFTLAFPEYDLEDPDMFEWQPPTKIVRYGKTYEAKETT